MSSPADSYWQLLHQGGLIEFSRRTILLLTGADRVRYLNGQVTSNVAALKTGATQPACVTTAKGKLCAVVLITSLPDALVVDADESLRESLPARLERYIVADDVELVDGSEGWSLFHFLPPAQSATDTLTSIFPEGVFHQPARRFGRAGVDILLPPSAAGIDPASFAAGAIRGDESLAEALRIEAGVPKWGRELGEDTLPPEAGLDRTHIDYHKGCYIGQEVISRLKSVGHVNRQLTGFVSENGVPLSAGMNLFHESIGAPAGVLTSATHSFALEKPIALGYLKRGSPTDGLIARPADSNGAEARVTVQTLPLVP